MLEIDGSFGEGGGQIIRTAVALSAVTQTPIKLDNIRKGRKKPGLAAQHITAVKVVAELCNGTYTRLYPGCRMLEFSPGEIRSKDIQFDIGTAGSITLVLQACLLPALFGIPGKEIEISLRGGTDVSWSPPIDYFRLVFLKNLARSGIKVDTVIKKRGYYPKGGGEVIMKMIPTAIQDHAKIDLSSRGKLNKITGVVHSRLLPEHICSRMLQSAFEKLKEGSLTSELELDNDIDNDIDIDIDIDIDCGTGSPSLSPGTGIVLAANCEHSTIGASALGARGIPAEQVGAQASEALLNEVSHGSALDVYAGDQFIPYLGVFGGEITVKELSLHTKTNIWLVEQFINKKFKIDEYNDIFKISL